ncbi:MAG: tRNA (adenosine(37)-N6)-threonylcarbamoyltransferase complex ATPase subunit type 1 TsaE [Verrucomicrobia bacterium]|nr:tRNA (adenosine(37)-N6)-threonylcarbamoyltransferase complex ATPase subunit type 1 TsaE [Verrucomicrobiota bacterium]MCG2680448.1 tRNA (adenosine(37)-N6)-threonylcarbamoyltransferase complex ATPase subunit type 1 TsaE [Kiritimatiellia bacterium]MBU4247553.1 tRNA (adenosine(37)-N6)-threonylcarbamoyltransferase complex ATPase subunit type 1 TsaE [Verrucomicrobiota bacterium]MBU4291259.1 tRNA (adenosine(37)-N6)-threonylcarbamoyltransferase complex ATPase subunit type 1 TsaE [Verrucomicrobiota ba
MKTRTVISKSPEETRALAASLLTELDRGVVLALHGELGSGKTCFVQGLALALGVRQAVTSPTFTLINEYAGRWPLYHIDLYRLRGAGDLASLGLDDYLESDGITVIEWAERAADLFPESTIHLYFETLPDPEARSIEIVGYDEDRK